MNTCSHCGKEWYRNLVSDITFKIGAAQLRSFTLRNRSEVIVLQCKQKPYAFDNLLHAFLAFIPSLQTTCVASVSGSKAGARVNAVYPPRGTCAEESNGIRFPKLVNQTLPQKDNTLADFTVLNEPSQSYY